MGDFERVYLWKIKRISEVLELKCGVVCSPEFVISDLELGVKDEKFQIKIHPGRLTEPSRIDVRFRSETLFDRIKRHISLEVTVGNGDVVSIAEVDSIGGFYFGVDVWAKHFETEDLRKKLKNQIYDELTIKFRIGNKKYSTLSKAISYFWDAGFPHTELEIDDHSFISSLPSKVLITHHQKEVFSIDMTAHEEAVGKLKIYVQLFAGSILLADQRQYEWNFNKGKKFIMSLEISSLKNNMNKALQCEFVFDEVGESSFEFREAENVDILKILSKDFENMFRNRAYCDVKICLADGTIPAHKCVLAARSPVFSAMFDQDMMGGEANSGMVDIPDCKGAVFQVFLKFLYSGYLEVKDFDYEEVLELLHTAHKYQVTSLETKCLVFLKNSMKVKNICEILSVADMVGDAVLKSTAIQFIMDYADEVLQSSEWAQWVTTNVVSATEIFDKLPTKKFSTKGK